MKPPIADPRSQALAWAQVFRNDWEECREDPIHAPGKAWSLLAAWGAVCRFFPPEALPAEASAVSVLVRQDASALLKALREVPAPAEWIGRAGGLDSAWDFATREETVRELEDAAVNLFDELDRHSLAVCMAQRLAPDGATAEYLASWRQQVEQAEDCFRDHIEAFLPAAPLAGAVFAACRPGLEEDEGLWRTVLKHGLLEETAEELAAAPVVSRLERPGSRAARGTIHPVNPVLHTWPAYAGIAAEPPPQGFSRLLEEVEYPAYAGIAGKAPPHGWKSYECRDPDQRYTAFFELDHPDQQPEVVLTFYRDGDRAGDLEGTTIRLRGVPATIDRQGRARFPRSLLDHQTGLLRLEVGNPPVIWPFRTEFSHEPPGPAGPVA